MARTARKSDPWMPASAAVAPVPVMPSGTGGPDFTADGPVADLHRLIEARLRESALPQDHPNGVTGLDALLRGASRTVGWLALIGTLTAMAFLVSAAATVPA